MKKQYYFIVFIAVLTLSFFNITAYAQDVLENSEILLAQNTHVQSPDIESDIESDIEPEQKPDQEPENKSGHKPDHKPDEELDDILDNDLDNDFFDDFNEYPQNRVKSQTIADPLYYFNYSMYVFNDTLYFAVLKPLAKGYKALTPSCMRKSVHNFFHNLIFPIRFVNNLLQGKVKEAGTEVGIFLINSSMGFTGFGKVAQNRFNLHTSNEDLGQTLGSYSIGNGFYLVLPILGPSTLRDSIGLAGDSFLSLLNYVEPLELAYSLKAFDSINTTSFRLGDYESLKKAALDPYTSMKDAYIQNRNEKIGMKKTGMKK